MSKLPSPQFTTADVIKFIAATATACGFYYGITSRQDEISAKLDKYIAVQEGIDRVQDLRISNLEADMPNVSSRDNLASQPAMKPKPVSFEQEED